MTEIIAVAVITVLAVISPGADFAMVVRNSYLYGRTTGLLAATGVAAGVLVHVTYTMLGVGLLIASSTALFTAIKLAGAAYLVYIGVRTFFARNDLVVDLESKPLPDPARGSAHRLPDQRAEPQDHTLRRVDLHPGRRGGHRPVAAGLAYGFFMSAAHLGWFALVALFFSHEQLRTAMLRWQKVLNRGIGSVLIGLGVTLGLAR